MIFGPPRNKQQAMFNTDSKTGESFKDLWRRPNQSATFESSLNWNVYIVSVLFYLQCTFQSKFGKTNAFESYWELQIVRTHLRGARWSSPCETNNLTHFSIQTRRTRLSLSLSLSPPIASNLRTVQLGFQARRNTRARYNESGRNFGG